MDIIISKIDIIRVIKKDYENKSYYAVACLQDNGYSFNLDCNEEFAAACSKKFSEGKRIITLTDIPGFVSYFQGKARVRIK